MVPRTGSCRGHWSQRADDAQLHGACNENNLKQNKPTTEHACYVLEAVLRACEVLEVKENKNGSIPQTRNVLQERGQVCGCAAHRRHTAGTPQAHRDREQLTQKPARRRTSPLENGTIGDAQTHRTIEGRGVSTARSVLYSELESGVSGAPSVGNFRRPRPFMVRGNRMREKIMLATTIISIGSSKWFYLQNEYFSEAVGARVEVGGKSRITHSNQLAWSSSR